MPIARVAVSPARWKGLSSPTVPVSSADEAPNTSNGGASFQEDVLARLGRLENIVIAQSEHSPSPADQAGSRPWPPQPRRKGDLIASLTERPSLVDPDWLESQITYPGSSAELCIAEYGKKIKPVIVRVHTEYKLTAIVYFRVQGVFCQEIHSLIKCKSQWPFREQVNKMCLASAIRRVKAGS